jgi:hypothetical protein
MNIYLTNQSGKYDITSFVPTITNAGDHLQASRTLSFSVLASPNDPNIPIIDIQLGNIIQVIEFDEEIFYGFIFDRNKSTESNSIDIECYDKGIYLNKNKYSYKFSGLTPEDITQKVASQYKISTGSIASTGIRIKRNFLGVDIYSVIIGSYYQASIQNGKKYMIRFKNNSLNIIEKGSSESTQILKTGYNLLTSTVSESIKDMVNSVAVFDKDDNLFTTIQNENDIALYGLMQEYHKISENEDYTSKARSMLKAIERKITVTNFGNIRCITGNAVIVQEPYTKLYGLFYIDGDTHTWKNGLYTNKLILNFQNLMDEKEVGTVEKSSNSNVTIQWTPESQKSLT